MTYPPMERTRGQPVRRPCSGRFLLVLAATLLGATALAATPAPDEPARHHALPAPGALSALSKDDTQLIRITRADGSGAPDQVDSAYRALQSGDLPAAEAGYQQALRADPKRVDALLGLASIAVRQARTRHAENYFRAALEAEPKNAAAHAGLSGLQEPADAVRTESRLKIMLAEQPDSAALNFALGNLYARQKRWSEAQAAYFKAHAMRPDNADYLFNLAVSLDHLRRSRMAARYYLEALAAAETHPAGFDAEHIIRRLRDLEK